MVKVGIRQLKEHASDLLRRVRERNEIITITHRGRAVARLVPVTDEDSEKAEARTIWAGMDELAQEIDVHWPEGVSAVDAVHEQRREI